MLSSANVPAKVYLSKNLVTDQTFAGFNQKLNTSGAFDATLGYGFGSASTSTSIIVAAAGFNDQRITSVIRWTSPTTAAGYEIGVQARLQTMDTNPTYYYARVDGDVAKLTKVVSGSFTNLSTSAFVLPVDTDCTVVLSCVGSTITATFTAAGVPGSPLTLTASDSTITTGGAMGVRSLTSTVWMKSFLAEQV
jgi:hypothetical protein